MRLAKVISELLLDGRLVLNTMRAVIFLTPFHPGDQTCAEQTLAWVGELGGCKGHSIILMPAKKVKQFDLFRQLAERSFDSVSILPDAEGIEGHPQGPNSMMRQAIWHMQTKGLGPWTFWEPDCIPLVARFADLWEDQYRSFGKPFMGELRPAHDLTPDYLTGNMVLPKDALLLAPMLSRRGLSRDGVELAFDIVAASQTLPQAHLTRLLQQVPKNADGSAHHFPDRQSLQMLREGAVFFHPCKDLSLIDRLREVKQLSGAVERLVEIKKHIKPDPANTAIESLERDIETLTKENEILRAELLKLKQSDTAVKKREAAFKNGDIVGFNSANNELQTHSARSETREIVKCVIKNLEHDKSLSKKKITRRKKKRTKEQQAAIDSRMAALRARKKVKA